MHGGCQCGEVRYRVSRMPLTLYACHCTDCQRQSSSSFGLSMPVAREGFHVDAGEPRLWQRTAESGRVVACASCPACGTRLFHAPQRNPAIVNVKPGSLDDTHWLAPVAHLWLGSAQGWLQLPDDVLKFEGQPDEFAPIIEAWTRRYELPGQA